VNAGFFDVLHDAGDQNVFAVGEGVHIDFGGVFEKLIDQDGALGIGGVVPICAACTTYSCTVFKS
jgi:hypothetical protein